MAPLKINHLETLGFDELKPSPKPDYPRAVPYREGFIKEIESFDPRGTVTSIDSLCWEKFDGSFEGVFLYLAMRKQIEATRTRVSKDRDKDKNIFFPNFDTYTSWLDRLDDMELLLYKRFEDVYEQRPLPGVLALCTTYVDGRPIEKIWDVTVGGPEQVISIQPSMKATNIICLLEEDFEGERRAFSPVSYGDKVGFLHVGMDYRLMEEFDTFSCGHAPWGRSYVTEELSMRRFWNPDKEQLEGVSLIHKDRILRAGTKSLTYLKPVRKPLTDPKAKRHPYR